MTLPQKSEEDTKKPLKFKRGDLVRFVNPSYTGSNLTFKVAYRDASGLTLNPVNAPKEGTEWQWFSDEELKEVDKRKVKRSFS